MLWHVVRGCQGVGRRRTRSATFARRGVLAATPVAAAAGIWYYYSPNATDALVPTLGEVEPISQMACTPIKPLSYTEAISKLEERAQRLTLQLNSGARGRIDVVQVLCNEQSKWSLAKASTANGREVLFAGIYDGHNGCVTSSILKKALIPLVSDHLSRLPLPYDEGKVAHAIREEFKRLDDHLILTARIGSLSFPAAAPEAISFMAPANSGSRALLAIYNRELSMLTTALVGDSRAVLGSYDPATGLFSAKALTETQTGLNGSEVERVTMEHPQEKGLINPTNGKLLGNRVTRSFGDGLWKQFPSVVKHQYDHFFGPSPLPNCLTPPYITAEPVVATEPVKTQDFVILGSSALWRRISAEDAVDCVSRWLQENRDKGDRANPCVGVDDRGGNRGHAELEPFDVQNFNNAASCLAKNALGGDQPGQFQGVMTSVRSTVGEDITVQIIFFDDPA